VHLHEVIIERRSIRKFTADPLPAAVVEDILHVAARTAHPTYAQGHRVLYVPDRDTIEKMREACIDTIERRVARWTPEDEKSWAQLGIPFPKHEKIGNTQKDHYRYFSRRFDTFFGEAPAVLVLATRPLLWTAAPHVWPTLQLVGAVMQTLQLAAAEKGVGSCCMTGPLHSRQALGRILDLAPPWEIVALLPLGYPQRVPSPRPRKPLSEVIRWVGPKAHAGKQEGKQLKGKGPAGGPADFRETVMARCNVYAFGAGPVLDRDLEDIVDTARFSPNSLNQQKWRFVVVRDKGVLHSLGDAMIEKGSGQGGPASLDALDLSIPGGILDAPDVTGGYQGVTAAGDFIVSRARLVANAPAVVALCNETFPSGESDTGWSDIESIGCAAETLMLEATARGYASCWMTSPLVAWEEVDRLLGVVDPWRTVSLVALGRSAGS